jgi:hypothetical protein
MQIFPLNDKMQKKFNKELHSESDVSINIFETKYRSVCVCVSLPQQLS